MSKESFKVFARKHPELANKVIRGAVSWQKLYEIYDIYGEEHNIWNNYFNDNSNGDRGVDFSSFKELFNTFKNLDMDTVQKGVDNIQKTIGLIQELGLGSSKNLTNNYEPRPLYKYFED